MTKQPTIYLASDHGGYQLKKRIARYLENELGLPFEDMGPDKFDAEDDFPDYIVPAAKKAVKNKGKAIFVCGSGIGACISANKVKGMYAALAYNLEAAELSRLHNNVNGLCLAGRVLTEEHALAIVKRWLETEFSGVDKYRRRNEKIVKLECDDDAELQKICEPTENAKIRNAKLQNGDTKLIYSELSYKINGILFEVKKGLSDYTNEKQICDKIEFYLKKENVPYERECVLPKSFEGETKGRNRTDFIIDDKIILETKTKRFLDEEDYHQIQRYLHALNKKLGILVNFRDKRISPKRILNSDSKE